MLGIFSSNSYDRNINCNNFIYGFDDNFNIEKYVEDNPYTKKKNNVYLQLDLFPNLNSLKCLGKTVNIDTNTNYQVYATSFSFYKLILFLSMVYLFLIFSSFQNKSVFLYILVSFLNLISIAFIFFGEIIFDYRLLGIIVSVIFYFFLVCTNQRAISESYDKLWVNFLFFNFVLLLFEYNIYSQLLIFLFFVYYFFFKNIKFSENEINLTIFVPIFYFFLRQISGPTEYFNQMWEGLSAKMFGGVARFADMYYALRVINCSGENCQFKNNYGPLWEFIYLDFNLIFVFYFLSLLTIFITQVMYLRGAKALTSHHLLIYFIYISPPIVFVIERMNFDLLVIIIAFFAKELYSKNYKIGSLLILTLLTLIKIYPILFIVGIGLYEAFNKNYKDVLVPIFASLINLFIYIIYYVNNIQGGFIPNPSGITWTFGLMSDLENYSNILNISIQSLFIVSTIFLFITQVFLYRSNYTAFLFNSENTFNEVYYLLPIFFVGLYFNFDYRLCLLSIPLYYLFKNNNFNLINLSSITFLLTSVSKYFDLDSYPENIYDFISSGFFIIINHLSFYLFFNLILYEFIKLSTRIKLKELYKNIF